MSKTVNVLNRGKQSLFSAAIWVSLLAIACKALGFVREAIIAAFFGATAETDAYFFAQNMPAMLFPAVCNSFAMAFTSFYVKRISIDEVEGDFYGSKMLNTSIVLGCFLSLIGILASPLIVPIFAPGFAGVQLNLGIKLTRIAMITVILTMLVYMMTSILNSKRFFIGAQVAGVVHNIVLIIVLMLLGRDQSMETLTFTYVLGLAVQVAVLFFCCRNRFQYALKANPFTVDTKQLLVLALPVILGNCVAQLNSIVDKMLCTTLENGAVSALSYATSLYTVVVSVFILSLSSVLYPSLIENAAQKDYYAMSENLKNSMLSLSGVLFIVSIITVHDSSNIVQTVFGRGSFDKDAISLTSQALTFYGPCFVFYGFREALSKAFYAMQDSKTPMINSFIGVGINILTSMALVKYMGISGIALGTTLSAAASSLFLALTIKKRIPEIKLGKCKRPMIKQAVASAVSLVIICLFDKIVSIPSPMFCFCVHVLIGFGVYIVSLFVIREEYSVYAVRTLLIILKERLSRRNRHE